MFSKLFSLRVLLVAIFSFLLFEAIAQPPVPFLMTRAGSGPAGYYFLTALKPASNSTNTTAPYYNLILDKNGDVIYYKKFSGAFRTCDFKVQPNGKISYFSKDKFYVLNSSFEITDSVSCKNGIQTDNHELLLLASGNYALMGTETFTMNLSSYKVFNHQKSAGSPTAQIISGVIQEQDRAKNVVFEWHCKDHFNFLDVDTFFISDPTKVDWTHVNSLYADKDGNYILSVRHLNEVTKIRRSDSSIIWRFGGKNNQFKIINDKPGFVGQHDVRRIVTGNLTLLDNGREQAGLHPATAKEYRINEKNKTANLVWKHVDDAGAHSVKGLGNVQRLTDGSTLINYGTSNSSLVLFNIHNPAGKNIFEIIFEDTLRSYRVYHYEKLPKGLTRPVVSSLYKEGKMYLVAGKAYTSYLWSTGSRTQMIEITEPGSYKVWVPAGKGGWLSSRVFVVKTLVKGTSR